MFCSALLAILGVLLSLAGSIIPMFGPQIEMLQYAQNYKPVGKGRWPFYKGKNRRMAILSIVLIVLGAALQMAAAWINFYYTGQQG